MEINVKYLVRGLNRDGSVERYYTGRTGQGWLGDITEAFAYDTEESARRKAKLFNTREPLTGFRFVSRPIYNQLTTKEKTMNHFQVIVGNIGTVYDGNNYMQASCKFARYVKDSELNLGRCAGESVTLMHDSEPRKEFIGTIDRGGGL